MKITFPNVIFSILLLPFASYCQNGNDVTTADTIISSKLAHKYISSVSGKADKIGSDLDNQTEKYLDRLEKQEAKIQKKLNKIDSVAAKNIFSNSTQTYQQLKTDLQNK